ncbi:linear amide C-N hydrolase [Moorena sp. SIO1G6]|uniref:linear amide C-N hydrolase n=1 Tax=Moorena sp. SIO1G6 TaxID=2607840 RepID=UPI002580C6B5|nr:linear amide C-N hydrolase [Moorena sp. SIO1G6]
MHFIVRTFKALLICGLIINLVFLSDAQACSRALHASNTDTEDVTPAYAVTGRSMDWYEDTKSNLWMFPAGMERDGVVGKNSVEWKSKYGSVIAAAYDTATADGLNEKGLMANMLFLAEADFGERDTSREGISWSAYTQYILDNFATVQEAVSALENDELQIVPSTLPSDSGISHPATLHFSLSDALGDSAIFEHVEGKLVIHHGKEFVVMTNSPIYDEQIALNAYWESVGGEAMLPGTGRAADRYVRASYYLKNLPTPESDRETVANVMSVIRNVSAPFQALTDPEEPNISSTMWRTAANHLSKVYYFESTLSPNIIWVELTADDLKEGAPVKKLELSGNYDLVGNVTGDFIEAEAFKFTGPCDEGIPVEELPDFCLVR